jgi:hypothetical protein
VRQLHSDLRRQNLLQQSPLPGLRPNLRPVRNPSPNRSLRSVRMRIRARGWRQA